MNEQISTLKEQAFDAYKKKNFQVSAQIFEECILQLESEKDDLGAAEMRNNLSVVLLELKQPDRALEVLQDADLVFANAGDKQRQAMSLGNMAAALQELGKHAEALQFYESSAELFKEVNEKEMRAITLKRISDLQLKTGKQLQALASLDASYEQKETRSLKEKVLQGFLGKLIKKITHS